MVRAAGVVLTLLAAHPASVALAQTPLAASNELVTVAVPPFPGMAELEFRDPDTLSVRRTAPFETWMRYVPADFPGAPPFRTDVLDVAITPGGVVSFLLDQPDYRGLRMFIEDDRVRDSAYFEYIYPLVRADRNAYDFVRLRNVFVFTSAAFGEATPGLVALPDFGSSYRVVDCPDPQAYYVDIAETPSGLVHALRSTGVVDTVDVQNRRIVQSVSTVTGATALAAGEGNSVYVTTGTGVYRYDVRTGGQLATYTTTTALSPLVLVSSSPSRVFVATDQQLVQLRADLTGATFFPRPSQFLGLRRGLSTDADGDGLDDDTEYWLSTDAANADTDGDGLTDGFERRLGTSPLVADSDLDGLDDGTEVGGSLDPRDPLDVRGDDDEDGASNGAELIAGTDPFFGGRGHTPVVLSETDKDPAVVIGADGLTFDVSVGALRAGRATPHDDPPEGYFEVERLVAPGPFGAGVATPSHSLTGWGGGPDGLGVDSTGAIYADDAFVGFVPPSTTVLGFVVNVAFNPSNGYGVYVFSYDGVTDMGTFRAYVELGSPLDRLLPHLYGQQQATGPLMRVNFGQNPSRPLVMDPRTIPLPPFTPSGPYPFFLPDLRWGGELRAPAPFGFVSVAPFGELHTSVGRWIALTPIAVDPNGNDVSDQVLVNLPNARVGYPWGVAETIRVGLKSSRYPIAPSSPQAPTPPRPDRYPTTVVVTADGADTDGDNVLDTYEARNGLDPTDPDTDDDGLDDGLEVQLFFLDPTRADTDGDGMPDGWEYEYRLQYWSAADASADADGDGFTNLAEYQAGTHPRDATSYPGTTSVGLSLTDKGPGIQITADGNGCSFTAGAVEGVRSNFGISPGSGFYYIETRRTAAPADFGIAITTASGPVNVYGGGVDSVAVDTIGTILYDWRYLGGIDPADDVIGLAVDYRGTHPIVHIMARSGAAAPRYVASQTMVGMTAPAFFHLYGPGQAGAGPHLIINAGDVAANPLAIDPRSVLSAAGVAAYADVTPRWPTGVAGP